MATKSLDIAIQDVEQLFERLIKYVSDQHDKAKVSELHGRFRFWRRRTRKVQKTAVRSSTLPAETVSKLIKQLGKVLNDVHPNPASSVEPLRKESDNQSSVDQLKTADNLIKDLYKVLSTMEEVNKLTPIATELRTATKLWRHAQEAYALLQKCLQCDCSEHHCVDLTLPTSSIQYARLHVVFHFSGGTLSRDTETPWTMRAATLEKSTAWLDSGLTQSPDTENSTMPPWSIGPAKSLGAMADGSFPVQPEQNLCLLLKSPSEQLGDLSAPQVFAKYSIVAKGDQPPCTVISLKDRLDLDPNSGLRLSRVTRYSLALDIAKAHVQLHPSTWLGSEWRAGDIVFMTEPADELNRPRLRRFIKNSTSSEGDPFHSLGILLLELCFGRSIDHSGYRGHGDPETAQDKYFRDVLAASQWLKSVKGEAGTAYHNAVSWLLAAPRREGDTWREEMREDIIGPLRISLEALTSPSSRIYSPVRSFSTVRQALLDDVERIAAVKLSSLLTLKQAVQPAEISEGRAYATRAVFQRHEEMLEELYAAAEIERESVIKLNLSTIGNTIDEDDIVRRIRAKPSSRGFRRAIIGDGHEHSRTRILAILLYMNVKPTSRTWARFIDALDLETDLQTSEPQVICPRDSELPLPTIDGITEFLGSADASVFAKQQYRYCALFTESFNEQSRALKQGLDVEVLIRPEFISDQTQSYKDLNEIWCSASDIEKFVRDKEPAVKNLYLQYERSQQKKLGLDESVQWNAIRAAQNDAGLFWNGVLKGRARIFAILIYSSAPAEALAWTKFIHTCMDRISNPELLDENLPFDQAQAESCLSRNEDVNRRFLQDQMIFCDIKLKIDDELDVFNAETKSKHPQRLPFMEKTLLSSRTSGGTVFKVKIRKGHYSDSSEDKELAMKQMRLGRRSAKEMKTLEWLLNQRLRHSAIMRRCTSLVTTDHIYCFMELADANLYEYMTEKATQPPKDLNEWKHMLRKIIDIADALKYLHCDLSEDHTGEPMICYHQDIKPENILVTKALNGPVFQLADFGISSIKRAPKISSGKLESMFDRNTTGSSTKPSETRLGDDCRNLAPELEMKGHVTAAVDVWAFGVVLSEYIAWLAGGAPKLRDFENARRGDDKGTSDDRKVTHEGKDINNDKISIDEKVRHSEKESDNRKTDSDAKKGGKIKKNDLSFHTPLEGRQPILKTGVRDWLKELEAEATSDRPSYQQVTLASCACLLRDKLLVCNPSRRAKSTGVCKSLNNIFDGERYREDNLFDRSVRNVTELVKIRI